MSRSDVEVGTLVTPLLAGHAPAPAPATVLCPRVSPRPDKDRLIDPVTNPDKFEIEDFVEPRHRAAAQDFRCGTCGRIPLNPVFVPASAKCSHIFCGSCASKPNWRCNVCAKDLTSAERQPLSQCYFLFELYEKQKVRCPFWTEHGKLGGSETWESVSAATEASIGDEEPLDEEDSREGERARHFSPTIVKRAQCDWKGTIREFRSHLLECRFKYVSSGSDVILRRKDMVQDRQSDRMCNLEHGSMCGEWTKAGTMDQPREEKADVHEALALKEERIDVSKADFEKMQKKVKAFEEPRRSARRGWGRSLASVAAVCIVLGLYLTWLSEEREEETEKEFSLLKKTQKEREEETEKEFSQLKRMQKEQETETEKEVYHLGAKMQERETETEKEISHVGAKTKEREIETENEISHVGAKMKALQAQGSDASIFEWEIQNPVEMKAKHPKVGDSFYSPEFFLRGLGPWQVQIYPSGLSKDPDGVGVFLQGSAATGSAKVKYRLSVNNHPAVISENVFNATEEWGYWQCPGLAWPETDAKPVRVKVEMLKVTSFVTTK